MQNDVKKGTGIGFPFSLLFLLLFPVVLHAEELPGFEDGKWVPPIGIPRPEFGIEEQPEDFYDSSTLYTAGGFNYKIYNYQGRSIPYTHFVDNTAGNCGTGDAYGTSSVPICDIPSPDNTPAGSVILIKGGTDTQRYAEDKSVLMLGGMGTAAKPVFILGVPDGVALEDKPRLGTRADTMGSYVIVENLRATYDPNNGKKVTFTTASWGAKGFDITHHIGFRNNYVHDYPFLGRNNNLSAFRAAESKSGDPLNAPKHNNIVFYKNTVYRLGDITLVGNEFQHDMHGFGVQDMVSYVWIVDNVVSEVGGDAVQGNGYNLYDINDIYPNHIFVGRNDFSWTRENAIDLKEVQFVVMSQNKFHHVVDRGIDNYAVVIHKDGNPPRDTWTIFNEVYASDGGIALRKLGGSHFVIGNVIYNISSPTVSNAISISDPGGTGQQFFPDAEVFVVGNTIYDSEGGLQSVKGKNVVDSKVHFWNNIAEKIYGTGDNQGHLFVDWQTVFDENQVDIRNNLLHNPGSENVRLQWGSAGYYDGPFESFPDKEKFVNTIVENPLFVDADNEDFSLQSGSPAIDSGKYDAELQAIFDKYENDIGVRIDVDYYNQMRIQGGGIDIGALEYGGGGGRTDPEPVPYGDVDGNGVVQAVDAMLALEASVGLKALSTEQTKRADVDGYTGITANDALLILKYAVGLIDSFPVETP